MDLLRLGLTRRLYPGTPDLELFTATPTHTSAIATLRQAFDGREPFALLDGEGGLGKSITACKFLEQLPEETQRYYFPSCKFTRPVEFFQTVLFDAQHDYLGLTEHEARLAVVEHLVRKGLRAGPMVFFLDEAHHLSDELLEELRLLSNHGTRSGSLLFIGLSGLPSLRHRLDKAGWSSAFGQRLSVRIRLSPMSALESMTYLREQQQLAGRSKQDLFTQEGLELCAHAGRGIPRLLNQIGALAASLACEAEHYQIDAEAVLGAIAQLGLSVEDGETELPIKLSTRPKPGPNASKMTQAEQRTERAKPKRKAS